MFKPLMGIALAGLTLGSLRAESVQLAPHTPKTLHAGPIEVKLEDGELRYFRAGGQEIVRRIYFAVRDKTWNTPPAEFSRMELEDSGDGFRVQMAAHCKSADVEYDWSGVITGTKDGRIVFDCEGTPDVDFRSNRIGLSALFGTALLGQNFETLDAKGQTVPGSFPELVSPKHVAEKFQSLVYTTAAGMKVSCKLEGATFDMEDQRNWGDTSFKAYAALRHAYPNVKKGDRQHETITVEASNVPDTKAPGAQPVEIRMSKKPIEGAKIPATVQSDAAQKPIGFQDANMNRKKYAEAEWLTIKLTSMTHLSDDDTLMENAPAAMYQARTAKQFSPKAQLRFAPVGLFSSANSGPDARNLLPIGAAWTATVVKYLSLGGVGEMALTVGPGPAEEAIKAFASSAGKPLLETEVKPDASGVEAFCVEDAEGRTLWAINTSPEKRQIRVEETGAPEKVKLFHIYGESGPDKPESDIGDGHVTLTLLPYEVCRIIIHN